MRTIKAYKGTTKNGFCRDFKYELGKTYSMEESPEICTQGFHACTKLKDVFTYYPARWGNRFFEVSILGEISKKSKDNEPDSKIATNKIKIKRELKLDEILEIIMKEDNGNLRLYGWKNISKLPDDLNISGDLDLSYTNIVELPKNLKVGGSLCLIQTDIIKLPDSLSANGDLYLCGTKIAKLPDGLKVDGYLNLSDTAITELPEDLSIGGSLNLCRTKVTELPEDLSVGGNLYLEDTNITELPKDLKVDGKIFW